MSFPSCPYCVVVLNQQQEQNISQQNQFQDVPVNHSKSEVKNCTVVENGRVVVKPLRSPPSGRSPSPVDVEGITECTSSAAES